MKRLDPGHAGCQLQARLPHSPSRRIGGSNPGLHRALPVRRGGAARHGDDHDHDPARPRRPDALLPPALQAASRSAPGLSLEEIYEDEFFYPLVHQGPPDEALCAHGRGQPGVVHGRRSTSTTAGSSSRRRAWSGSTSSAFRSASRTLLASWRSASAGAARPVPDKTSPRGAGRCLGLVQATGSPTTTRPTWSSTSTRARSASAAVRAGRVADRRRDALFLLPPAEDRRHHADPEDSRRLPRSAPSIRSRPTAIRSRA